MRTTSLNGGESPHSLVFPLTREEMLFAGLCRVCLDAVQVPLAYYASPVSVSALPPFTESEIEAALEPLERER